VLWPHARPFRLRHPEPLLRAIDDVAAVAAILERALRATLPELASTSAPATATSGHAA
jgi:hypothetical protein